MADSTADAPKDTDASITGDVSDTPISDLNATVAPVDQSPIGISASSDGIDTGDSLVQALVQLGDGHSFAGSDPMADASSNIDMSDVGAIADDLGMMLDQLGPSLDALISEVNLFDIAIPGDTLGDT